MEMDEERKARLKKMVATTQLRLAALETGFDLDLFWIDIGIKKYKKLNSRKELQWEPFF